MREFRLMAEEAGNPNEKASLMINEVRCYCSLGRLGDAERTLGEIRDLAVDDVVVRVNVDFGAASLAAQRGDMKNALVRYEAILQEYVQLLSTSEYRDLYEDIQQRRAFALANLDRYAESLSVLREATSFRTLTAEDHQQIHLYLGICYGELRESALAKDELLRAIDFGLKNDVEAQARYRAGILYFSAGAFAQAKYQLQTILEDRQGDIPNLPRGYIYEQLSRTCHYLGEEENARRYMKMAQRS